MLQHLTAFARVAVLNKVSQKDLVESKKLDIDGNQFMVKTFGKDSFEAHEVCVSCSYILLRLW